jgi:S1-C subfamily serine protease
VDVRDVPEGSSTNSRTPRGAEILHVDHDAPAGKAGLREHDIVLIMNGQPIESGDFLRRMLHETPPGRPVTLTIVRGGQQQAITAQMSTREDVEREAWEEHVDQETIVDPAPGFTPGVRHGNGFFSAPGRAGRSLLGSIGSSGYTGVMLETMAPQLAEFFGAQGKSGMLVRSVDANSPAAVAGLHAGDVVVRVNSVGIASSSDWSRVVRDNKGRAIAVVVLRERREQTLMLIPNAKHRSSLFPDLWPHFGSSLRSAAPPDHAAVIPANFLP